MLAALHLPHGVSDVEVEPGAAGQSLAVERSQQACGELGFGNHNRDVFLEHVAARGLLERAEVGFDCASEFKRKRAGQQVLNVRLESYDVIEYDAVLSCLHWAKPMITVILPLIVFLSNEHGIES